MSGAAVNLIAVLATLAGISTSAQSVPVKNIVLVHGAWADGSGWEGVYEVLVKDHFNVSIVQEPETSFKDDVAATKTRACAARRTVHSCRSLLRWCCDHGSGK